MRYHSVWPCVLGLNWLVLASCADQTTAPNLPPTSAAPDFALASNTWLARRDLPYSSWTDVSTATIQNAAGESIVFAMGGGNETGACLIRTRAYNVRTNTWSPVANMPRALCGMNGAGVINGKIYVAGGGLTNGSPTNSLFVFDPAKNAWTQKRNMPVPGTGGVTGVIQGKLYVVTTKNDTAYFFRYNPSTDSWTRLPPPTNYHWLGGGGGVINGKLYLIANPPPQVYDPATNQWTALGLLPGDFHGSSVVLRDRLYIIGADTRPRGDNVFEHWGIFIYNPASNSWITKPLLTKLQDSYNIHAASVVIVNGEPRVEVIGGGPPGNNLQYVP